MGRPRETIDTSMLAAAIGIDRLVKGNIGRLIARDDRFGGLERHLRPQWWQILGQIPAIVFLRPGFLLEASACVRHGAAAPLGPMWRAGSHRRARRQLRHDRTAVSNSFAEASCRYLQTLARPCHPRLARSLPLGAVHCRHFRLCCKAFRYRHLIATVFAALLPNLCRTKNFNGHRMFYEQITNI